MFVKATCNKLSIYLELTHGTISPNCWYVLPTLFILSIHLQKMQVDKLIMNDKQRQINLPFPTLLIKTDTALTNKNNASTNY